MTATQTPLARAPATSPSRAQDSSVAACWAGLAAVGAGLVQMAFGSQNRSAPAVLIGFVLLGTVLLGWGASAMSRARPPLPRLMAGVLSLAVVGTSALAISGSAVVGAGLAALCTVALLLIALAALLVDRRRDLPDPDPRAAAAGRPVRHLLVLAVAALVTAGLTTPALADTTAGEHARPHGSHLLPGLHEHG